MKFISTRGGGSPASFSEALRRGLAPDGGLYVPDGFPALGPDIEAGRFSDTSDFAGFGARLLAPFLDGDPLAPELPAICTRALNFPLPLKPLARETSVLELFHGPTCAFKDVGARFLSDCLARSPVPDDGLARTVLVATSGDTGGAVAAAFFDRPGFDVVILFPKEKISARQERQLTCWGGNVRAFAVRGSFDDCQAIVKAALREAAAGPVNPWHRRFYSANSISLGRLLPQMIFHAKASMEHRERHGGKVGIVVPTGNLGDAVAALWAKRVGFPIDRVMLATNANATISDFFETGTYAPRPSVSTLANAMDVGDPSNMERLRSLFPDVERLRENVSVEVVTDGEIARAIREGEARWGEIWCPHTATGVVALERARAQGDRNGWILLATAHPAKFETIVEPLIGHAVPVPESLRALLDRPSVSVEIEPSMDALKAALEA